MIITSERRWCRACCQMTNHDIESELKRGKTIEVAQTCLRCLHRTMKQHLTRAAQQNGGGGDQNYRTRRATK